MSILANANSRIRGQFARGEVRPQPPTAGAGAHVVVRPAGLPSNLNLLDRPHGTPKVATMEIATNNVGMTAPFPRLSGAHGVVADAPPVPDLTGGQQTWSTPRRTLRRAPLVPWDAGTEIGATAAPGNGGW